MYLAASSRSQVATAQHGDHGFPKCRILYPDIRDMFSSALPPFQKDVTTRQPLQLTFKAVSLARTTNMSFYSAGLWRVVGKAASRAIDRVAAMQCCESTCTEMHRVVISRIESSLFSVRSASLFTVWSCRFFRCIYTPHSGYQTFVRL